MGSPSVGITNTAWHHYAGTYSQLTGIRNLYVDGVLAAQENNNGAYNLANYSHVVIGGFEGSPGGTINNFLNAEFYDVRLYNYDLSSNAVAALAAVPDPAIMANPQPTTAYVGLSAQFITAVEGTGPFTYQWRINGTNLVNGTLGGALVSGATSDALTIANLTTNLVGTFIIDVVVTGANGTATSRTGTLTVVPTAVPPAANLVGAWLTGAASLADVSGFQPKGTHDGYGVTGTGTPSATFAFTNDVPSGQAGQSLWLYDGSTSIAISNSASGDANYTNTFDDTINIAFTVTCWAKGIPGSWATFVAKDGEGTVGWMSRVNGSEDPCFTIRGTGGTDDMAEGNNSNDGNWHFYAGTYDSVAGNRDLYVDGQLVVSETGNVEYTLAPNAHLAFGSRDTSGSSYGNFFTGEIYGVRIYDTALTAAEVNYLQLPTAPPARPAFSGSPAVINGKLVLQWSAGSLQQATNLTGPWVPSGATSPYTNNLAVPQLFFRLSNP
jgi:hypothetical protein